MNSSKYYSIHWSRLAYRRPTYALFLSTSKKGEKRANFKMCNKYASDGKRVIWVVGNGGVDRHI